VRPDMTGALSLIHPILRGRQILLQFAKEIPQVIVQKIATWQMRTIFQSAINLAPGGQRPYAAQLHATHLLPLPSSSAGRP
jgi:hypothetical protein